MPGVERVETARAAATRSAGGGRRPEPRRWRDCRRAGAAGADRARAPAARGRVRPPRRREAAAVDEAAARAARSRLQAGAARRRAYDSPKKIGLVAGREFMATVTNKGFLIGLLIMPAMFAVLVAVMPRLMTASATRISGEVAVIDPDRAGRAGAARHARPRRRSRRRAANARWRGRSSAVRRTRRGSAAVQRRRRAGARAGHGAGVPPRRAAGDGGPRSGESWLLDAAGRGRLRQLALVVVQPDAVDAGRHGATTAPTTCSSRRTSTSGSRPSVRDGLREALVTARLRGPAARRARQSRR